MNKDFNCKALVAIEPTTKKVMFADFSKNPYPEMEKQMRLIEEFGPELYFKNLTQTTFSPEINKEIWELMQENGSELECQVPGFQVSVEITKEDFEDVSITDRIPVFIFCQAYREKEYRESEYWTSKTKLILGGSHHYLQWSESEKIVDIIKKL